MRQTSISLKIKEIKYRKTEVAVFSSKLQYDGRVSIPGHWTQMMEVAQVIAEPMLWDVCLQPSLWPPASVFNDLRKGLSIPQIAQLRVSTLTRRWNLERFYLSPAQISLPLLVKFQDITLIWNLLIRWWAPIPFSHITADNDFQQRPPEKETPTSPVISASALLSTDNTSEQLIIIAGAKEAARGRCDGTERPLSKVSIVVACLDVRLEMNCSGERAQTTYLWFNLFIAQEVGALSCQLVMASFQTEQWDCRAACHRLQPTRTPSSQETAFKSVWQFNIGLSKSAITGRTLVISIQLGIWPDQNYDTFSSANPSSRRGGGLSCLCRTSQDVTQMSSSTQMTFL